MESPPDHLAPANRLGGATAKVSLAAILLLLSRDALASPLPAEPLRGPTLARAVRRQRSFWETWEIDPAVVARVNEVGTPELREQLVPVLAAAHARHAVGYDRLRAAVCTDDGMMSLDRAHACATLPAAAEDEWRRSDRTKQWLVRGGATAAYAGAITAAVVERDHQTSRVIATAAGVPEGIIAGSMVGAIAVFPLVPRRCSPNGSDPAGCTALKAGGVLAGAIAGGVLGGLWAHDLASSPGARAPVTAVGLAPLYLTTLIMTANW